MKFEVRTKGPTSLSSTFHPPTETCYNDLTRQSDSLASLPLSVCVLVHPFGGMGKVFRAIPVNNVWGRGAGWKIIKIKEAGV